jgi:ATP-binding cassette subfamily B protein
MQRLRGNEWKALASLLPYLWEYKWRVVLALACLVTAKLANVGVPLVMKEVVDGLDPSLQMVAVPVALLAIYGLLRFSTTLFQELRDVVFIRVTQRAIRRVALGVPAIVLFAPIFFEGAAALGIHPLHLGIVIILTLALGYVTPPYGLCLLIAAKLARSSTTAVIRAMVPFWLITLAVLLVAVVFPDVMLTIPEMLYPRLVR